MNKDERYGRDHFRLLSIPGIATLYKLYFSTGITVGRSMRPSKQHERGVTGTCI